MQIIKFPAPAVISRAENHIEMENNTASDFPEGFTNDVKRYEPGKLPESAATLSNSARGLLVRLLERDPRVRLRSLRQLQQSAFYMGFNFEHAKAKKVKPRSILESYFPEVSESSPKDICSLSQDTFKSFDQLEIV